MFSLACPHIHSMMAEQLIVYSKCSAVHFSDEADVSEYFLYRIYDKYKQGYITTDVLKEILREIDAELTEEELDEIVDEVDEDQSGTVDFQEFMVMMTGE